MTTATVGEPVTIELAATPTTGYQWRAGVTPPPPAPPPHRGTPAGASPGEGGVQWFRFLAREVGRFTLAFVLKRAWEDDPVSSQTVVVEVQGSPS
jgi:predicted secreted protein